MRKYGWESRRYVTLVLLAVMIIGVGAEPAWATTSSSSSNYQVTEMELGTGSSAQSCSSQYCAKASIGSMVVGESKTTSKTAQFGDELGSDPLLEVIIEPGVSNLGVLTSEKTASKTMKVRIRSYLSDGYTLQITGEPPKVGGHKLNTPLTPTASQPGTEQFGINAVVNTQPVIGENPVQIPSGEGDFGVLEDDYKTPDLFKYVSGDVVARSNTSLGRTDYTISMIVNIASSTPAGHYTGDFSAVVVPLY